MSKYYIEYGALQANGKRLIECETSALDAKKITEDFAREIADALNGREAWKQEKAEIEADALSVGGLVEAARHRPGNAAAMREALSKIYKLMTSDCPADEVEIANICFQSLSAPARNFDRFEDAKTARQAWLDDANNWDDFGSPELELHEWLFAPAAERKGE